MIDNLILMHQGDKSNENFWRKNNCDAFVFIKLESLNGLF